MATEGTMAYNLLFEFIVFVVIVVVVVLFLWSKSEKLWLCISEIVAKSAKFFYGLGEGLATGVGFWICEASRSSKIDVMTSCDCSASASKARTSSVDPASSSNTISSNDENSSCDVLRLLVSCGMDGFWLLVEARGC